MLADDIESGGGSDEAQFRARVLQGKLILAQAFGKDVERVWAEGEHYLEQYGGEAPTELQVCEKRKGRWRLIGGAVSVVTRALPDCRAVEAGNE